MGEPPVEGLEGEAAIDHMDRAGGEMRLVRGEVNGERGDLVGTAEPTQRLALDKGAAGCVFAAGVAFGLRGDALVQRRRGDGAGTDRVATDAISDEIGGD